MHLSMLSPTSPLLGIGGDLYNLLFKGHTPGAIIFYNTLSRRTQCPGVTWRFVCLLCYLNSSTITKSPLVGSIFLTEDTQIPTYAWEWGLTLIGALFSSDFSHMCMGLSFAV